MRAIRFLLVLAMVFCALSCKRTVEGEKTRYTQTKDRLEALATRNASMKADIKAKLAEFEAEAKKNEGKAGEEGVKAWSALTDRMANYERSIAPPPPAAGPDAGKVLGSKLGPAADAAGGKLGGGAAPPPPAGGKLGGGAAPDAAAGGSGFGGAPAAGAPDAAPAKSGFGGK